MKTSSGLNAGRSFNTGNRVVDSLRESEDKYMVIAPQFFEGIDPDEKGLPMPFYIINVAPKGQIAK